MAKRRISWFAVGVLVVTLACSPSAFMAHRSDRVDDSNGPPAERVIFFIGDGMGPQIVSIAKIYSEMSLEANLSMVQLANTGVTGYMTTHSQDRLVTDSAASGTAMATGVKTTNGGVGTAPGGRKLVNLFEEAVAVGKSVGVVTTTSVTDATPGSYLSHVPSRGMELEIARQIANSDASVVMGGGWLYFLPPERGKRAAGEDMTVEARRNGFEVVYDKQSLEDFEGARLLGLFAPDDLPFESARPRDEVPSLSMMMETAVEVLSSDPDGFLLVVEGGRIDHAEHDNMISEAIGDFLAFDAAIGLAMEYQAEDPLLTIVISADHDCGGPAITAGDYGYPPYSELESLVREDCAIVKWVSGGHTGTMVPVFARGPGAERFSGILDNTDMHDIMVWLLGL